jgi:hypothetical protein
VSTTTAAATRESWGVLAASVVAGVAGVSLSISRFVAVEVVEGALAASGKRPMVSVAGIKAVIDMAVKATMPVEPRTSSDEETAYEPVRPVIAVGGAVIRGIVKVPVRANGRYADVDAYAHLGMDAGDGGDKDNRKGCKRKNFPAGHKPSL